MTQQFSAAPKVVKPKQKYKKQQPLQDQQEQIKLIYNNLMWDKRIVRGNTYSAIVTSKNVDIPQGTGKFQRITMRNRQEEQTTQQSNRRANIQIFTDDYVESLTDKPPRYEYGSQTEQKIQKAIIRHQMDQKIGFDMPTQIWDNELFDFDYEVQPLLNVLCGRTLQISRMEVLQEEQLRIMRDRQRQLHLQQGLEKKKIQQMYALEQKLEIQNAKRLQNFKLDRQKKKLTHRRLFSRVIAKQYLRDIKNNTLTQVAGNGFFRNPIQEKLINEVLPHFYTKILQLTAQQRTYAAQATNIIEQSKRQLLSTHKQSIETQKNRKHKIIEKRNELEREKNQRKLMKVQEKYMMKFLQNQKVYLAQLKAKEEAAQNGQAAQVNQQNN